MRSKTNLALGAVTLCCLFVLLYGCGSGSSNSTGGGANSGNTTGGSNPGGGGNTFSQAVEINSGPDAGTLATLSITEVASPGSPTPLLTGSLKLKSGQVVGLVGSFKATPSAIPGGTPTYQYGMGSTDGQWQVSQVSSSNSPTVDGTNATVTGPAGDQGETVASLHN